MRVKPNTKKTAWAKIAQVLLAKQMRLRTMRAVFTSYNEGAIHLFRNLRLPYTIDIDHGETEMLLEAPQ